MGGSPGPPTDPFSPPRTASLSSVSRNGQALHLTYRLGAVRVSRALALDPCDRVRSLEQLLAAPSAAAEGQRHERVIERLVETKAETAARAVRIILPKGIPMTDLPAGVSLQPGLLTVAFATQEQLLERLFLLARVFAADPERLARIPVSE